ncbi:hypothetical protein VNO77_07050 [Canavalia gladiata]|uniref:phospholipase D n=1 Tax=Canavalia gladiata TaxID=3824 RepID=A0AAN9QT80_CANGL
MSYIKCEFSVEQGRKGSKLEANETSQCFKIESKLGLPCKQSSLVGGAAVGAVFGELLKVVLDVTGKAVAFKQTLFHLRSTLIAIAPIVEEIAQHNHDLGRPKEELQSLITQMEEGTKLVSKCSKIHWLNYVAKVRYQERLDSLANSLAKFFIIDMQAQTARDQKETLLIVRRIYNAIIKPTNRDHTSSVSGYGSDSESYYSMRTQLDEETDSIQEEQISRLTRSFSWPNTALDELMSNVSMSDGHPSSTPLTHSISVPKEEKKHGFYGYSGDSYSGLGHGDSAQVSVHSDDSVHSQSLQRVPAQCKGSLKVLLLHGNLDIWVHGAKKLPNMDMYRKTLGDIFGILPGTASNKIEGSYVSISVSNAVIGRTFVISDGENPVWEQHYYVPVAHYAAEVHFVVRDSDMMGSQLIGVVGIPVEQIYSGEKVQGTYPILNSRGKPCKPGAVLKVSIQYIPVEKLSIYHNGIGAGPDYSGVPGTYFPLRKGGNVTLYQDAHVPDGCLPNVILDNGMYYAHGKCWLDIFDAICQARWIIYIAGWSVWHKVRLVRDAGHASNFTLGELLRRKTQEGVRVCLLLWDDPTSGTVLGYRSGGLMETHDKETRRFFKNSLVKVLLCPRTSGKQSHWAKLKNFYAHHQKTVIVDADAGNNRRKIVAFVGGLDLCDGRYDTPYHPLFRTLQTLHKDDYHNPTYMEVEKDVGFGIVFGIMNAVFEGEATGKEAFAHEIEVANEDRTKTEVETDYGMAAQQGVVAVTMGKLASGFEMVALQEPEHVWGLQLGMWFKLALGLGLKLRLRLIIGADWRPAQNNLVRTPCCGVEADLILSHVANSTYSLLRGYGNCGWICCINKSVIMVQMPIQPLCAMSILIRSQLFDYSIPGLMLQLDTETSQGCKPNTYLVLCHIHFSG